MCHPNSNKSVESEEILSRSGENTTVPLFGAYEENIEIATALNLNRNYDNRIQTLLTFDEQGEENEREHQNNNEITIIRPDVSEHNWHELTTDADVVPSNRQLNFAFNQRRGQRQSRRNKRRLRRHQKDKKMYWKLKSMNKLLRKTVHNMKHIKNLLNRQMEVIKNFQGAANGATTERFSS